jgi:hypothetical protein
MLLTIRFVYCIYWLLGAFASGFIAGLLIRFRLKKRDKVKK